MDDITPPNKSEDLKGLASEKPVQETEQSATDNSEPSFMPPQEVADKEEQGLGSSAPQELAMDSKIKKVKKPRKFKFPLPHGKKQWLIFAAVVLILAGSFTAYWYKFRGLSSSPLNLKKVAAPAKPTTEISKLSGLEVPIGTNEKPVTAIQIENSLDARPQAGLKDASIVFEAIAEGGITRFNAIYQDTEPDYIGPVRSLRPYYIDWFWPFDASIAHVGGAPQALADVKSLGIKDLDQFYNSGAYERITSRYAPHNVYTSIAKLREVQQNKGFTSANYTGFARKKEQKLETPTTKTIDLNISGYYYNVHYDYDATNNAYLRSEGGAAHKDDKSGAQLEPKVVIAIVMSRGKASDGQHTEYGTVGSGHMFVFQDGYQTEGTWSKDSRQAQWKFTGADGKALEFNPGQTWITMVDSTSSVSYAP